MISPILLFISLLSFSVCQTEDPDGITVLDQTNFHKFIRENNNVFMFFHSSWDGRSKAFEYEYRLLAREVKKRKLDVKMAKINLPSNREIAEIYHIRNFPSLHFFQDGDDSLYDGRQHKNDILFFLTKKLSDDKFYVVTDPSEIKSHLGQHRAVVIAHFKDNKTLKYKFFDDALGDNEDVDILVGFGDTDMGIKPDSFCIYNSEGRRFLFDEKWETDTIRKWVYTHSFPVVIMYDTIWNRYVFSTKHDVNSLIIYMSEDNEPSNNKQLYEILNDLGETFMGQAFVLDMQADMGGMIDYFGFEREALPLFFFVEMGDHSPIKYVYHGEIDHDEMFRFVKEAKEGLLYPFYRSEKAYDHLDGFVKVLVAREFEDIAFDPMKNVLVEFVVPGCRMCDRVEDDYQHLAQDYIYHEDVLISKIDTSKNDLKDLVFPEFPTFILFKAGGDGEKRAVFSKDQIDYPRLKEFLELNKVPVRRTVEKRDELKGVKEDVKVEEVKEEVKEEGVKEEGVKEEDVKEEMKEEVKKEMKEETREDSHQIILENTVDQTITENPSSDDTTNTDEEEL